MQPPAPRDNFRRASAPPNAVQRGGGWRGRRRPRRGLRKGAFSPAEAAAVPSDGGPFIRRGERGRAGRHCFAAPAGGVHVCGKWSHVCLVCCCFDCLGTQEEGLQSKAVASGDCLGTARCRELTALGFSRDCKTTIGDCCKTTVPQEITRNCYSL